MEALIQTGQPDLVFDLNVDRKLTMAFDDEVSHGALSLNPTENLRPLSNPCS